MGPRHALAALLAVAAGLSSVVGSLLVWMRLSVDGQPYVELRGAPEGTDGWVVLGAGVVMVLAGAGLFSGWGRRPLSLLLLGAAALTLISGALALTTGRDAVADALAAAYESPRAEARERLEELVDAGRAELSTEPGLMVLLVGGGIGFLAGIVVLGAGRRRPARPVAAVTSIAPASEQRRPLEG